MQERIIKAITDELGIKEWQTTAVIELIDSGCTIPFIARYRKEATGALDDETLRRFDERLKYLRNLEERKNTVIASIEEQGKMTDELREKITAADTSTVLEDLYRPYRPKRKTRADIAKEKGLQGLADHLMSPGSTGDVMAAAAEYISEEKDVPDAETALKLAQDIIAGEVSDNADFREWIRNRTQRSGEIVSVPGQAGKEALERGESSVYENYYDYREFVRKIPGHRVLAINRGEKEKFLSVSVDAPEEDILDYLERKVCRKVTDACLPYVAEAIEDGYRRLIAPSISTEIRNMLTEKAEDGAIHIFGSNLEQLLMQPPVQGKTVLGWDPAFRTGCKLAVCDPTGKILDTAVIYPTPPQNKVAEAVRTLESLCDKYKVDIISVGNGTASRESERIIADFIKDREKKAGRGRKLQYVIVNEAGASVYSASKLATKEYPDLDVGERSSASIARRLQDPLAELVKIDPKAIGVGQYQHDMSQKKLGEALAAVVEDCVNRVGVDVNTASPSLLEYVSGISGQIAANIVKYRDENGRFANRKQLLDVPRLGPKAYEQCAGFLRITGGDEPLDATAVHPESYAAARAILSETGHSARDILNGGVSGISYSKELADKLSIGRFTFADIVAELEKPGRDPRSEAAAPVLRSDVMEISDLKPDMELKGTVRNIVDFGAFVDIGVHQDGLVHISEMSDRYVKHPLDIVKVGDIVDVRVLSVDEKRKKISLSMKKRS
ncbi:MAG: RNA-binding transcriptional accessory protein [Clostridiales bacterium]|nr:RNA-binding transcriptional accessory protein [Clostridiales bacterium]